MKKPQLELCHLLESMRPKDYRVQIIAPDGSVRHDRKFSTKADASKWANAKRQAADVAMTQFTDNAANN